MTPQPSEHGRFASKTSAKVSRESAKVSRLRNILYAATSEQMILKVWAALLSQANSGDLRAIKMVLDQLFGPPQPIDLMAQFNRLEEKMGEKPLHTLLQPSDFTDEEQALEGLLDELEDEDDEEVESSDPLD